MTYPPAVCAHPSGGWTHAWPQPDRPQLRIYRGWWRTRRAARRALPAAGQDERRAA